MFRIIVGIVAVVLLSPWGVAHAQVTPPVDESSGEQNAFRSYSELTVPVSPVPEVLEVDVSSLRDARHTYEVYDLTLGAFVPSQLREQKIAKPVPKMVRVPEGDGSLLVDGDTRTTIEFPFVDDGSVNVSEFTITSSEPVTADTLSLFLDTHVALPHTIAISARLENGSLKTLIAPRPLTDARVTFPRTTAKTWEVMLRHSQPLRLGEVALHEQKSATQDRAAIRFLSLPGHAYRIYTYPDRSVSVKYETERPQFDMSETVRFGTLGPLVQNTSFVQGDGDGDGIPDARDNCVSVPNADQVDVDRNYKGDACDDFDKDGRMNIEDNCVSTPNSDQRDTDQDQIGDACDLEESRFTEKHAWVPWVGIGFAALVILVLFALTLRMKPQAVQ
ncbi:MAG: hypothetical protein RLZZ234_303 [Candidatus Parcubacteria bacterium]|jgi:hypothetical protein